MCKAELTEAEDTIIRQTLSAIAEYKQLLRDSPAHGSQGRKAVEYEYLRSTLVTSAFELMDILSRLTGGLTDTAPDGETR